MDLSFENCFCCLHGIFTTFKELYTFTVFFLDTRYERTLINFTDFGNSLVESLFCEGVSAGEGFYPQAVVSFMTAKMSTSKV